MSKKKTSSKMNAPTGKSKDVSQENLEHVGQQHIARGFLNQFLIIDTNLIWKFKLNNDPDKFIKSMNGFENELIALRNAIVHAQAVFADMPLLIAYLIWTNHSYIKTEEYDYPKILIEKEVISFKNNDGNLLQIKDATKEFFLNALDSTRCRKDLSLHLKEALVQLVLDFNEWLSIETSSENKLKIDDPDRQKAKGRLIAFDDFIELLCNLDKRYQVVAKLLYFGGSRTLEQVISLQIENIDFAAKEIAFDNVKINYPRHIFEDLLYLIDGRTSGNVFEGRQNAPLNAATIFRNFKEAAARIPLEEFSPKSLTTDR